MSDVEYLPWINLFLIIFIIALIIAVFFIIYNYKYTIARYGLSWNLINSPTTGTTDSFTAGNYTLYINNVSGMILTINASPVISAGQEFDIANVTNSTISYTTGSNITIVGSTTINANTTARFIATNNSNNYIRIQ